MGRMVKNESMIGQINLATRMMVMIGGGGAKTREIWEDSQMGDVRG